MRIYTGRGDGGQTDLLGDRVSKDDPRIDLLGDLDESTSTIGLGRAQVASDETRALLESSQRDLYAIMAELAFTDATRPEAMIFPAERVAWLESTLDDLSGRIELPRAFVLPGESISGAALDVARTVVRRAERRAVSLQSQGGIGNQAILPYLNRLSSLLFILARAEDIAATGSVKRAKS